ncbi:hypothetical protein BCR35DRAFT_307883 [Leucosporidium creatinivorum]|uniref:Uncharacterized protein n=1 Tax=Leucosporidium creatinivorum TaxID=106004 RepID=A0A1Y2EGU5_9BASI|nr:hypothetical protein BCR35DRAFT_307883 [Leucosporidium creatinivorum]
MAWSTLFGAIWLAGIFSLPRWFGGLLTHWTVFFLAFLQLLVASGTLVVELSKVTCSATRCASLGPVWCIQDRCNTFYGLEGVTWVVTWLTFALLALIATEVMSRDSRRRKSDKSLKREMSRSMLSPVRTRASFEQPDGGSGTGSSEEAAGGKGDRLKGSHATV